MTLPAAAARAPAAVDRYLLPAPRLQQAEDVDHGTDRRTDGRTDMVPVPITSKLSNQISEISQVAADTHK